MILREICTRESQRELWNYKRAFKKYCEERLPGYLEEHPQCSKDEAVMVLLEQFDEEYGK